MQQVFLMLAALAVTAMGCGSGKTNSATDAGPSDGSPSSDGAQVHDGGGIDSPPSDAAGDAPSPPVTTHPTNILNNGSFEYGLMCYGQYEWGADPSNAGTGYQFSLSTDSQDGKYSLQITCVNASDCGFPAKAAVEAYAIPSPANQEYEVSIDSKCTAGDLAFFYTPSVASGSFTSDFSCTGDWATNTFTFTSDGEADASLTDNAITYSLYYAGNGTLLLDNMVMTFGDEAVPVHTVLHPGHRATSVTGTTTTVDGKPYVPLGFYQIPADQLIAAKQMGANAVAWGDPDCSNTAAPVFEDQAYAAGIDLIPESSTTARLGLPDVLPGVLTRFGSHLADVGWYLDDEPDLSAVFWQPITPAMLTSEYAAIHGASSLPVAVMLQEAHYADPSVDQPYAPAMDVYLSEPYGPDFSGIAHTASVFATMTQRPVWLAEDDSLDAGDIVPKAYYGFTSGATGLLFFTYAGFSADGNLPAAAQALTELSSLTDVITGTDVTSTLTPPMGISAIARQTGTTTTILAVNPDATNVSGSFALPGLTAGQMITVQFESRSIVATAGAFTDTFTGIARHVYVIP